MQVYMYVVDRDFGFAPNPFHGFCTLATCKPGIRSSAKVGDWVIGMGGRKLRATGRCIYAMQVTEKVTFSNYWTEPRFVRKRPVRNGSRLRMVGDNIYSWDDKAGAWRQADSHHSHPDGAFNLLNLKKDTKTDKVLISTHFFYFGCEAPFIPEDILAATGFKNRVGHRKFVDAPSRALVSWICTTYAGSENRILGDPCNFNQSEKRYSGKGSRVT